MTKIKTLYDPPMVSDCFDWLETAVDLLAANVDLVLYQASPDAHCDDPLGGLLNDEEMRERDELAFSLTMIEARRALESAESRLS